MKTNTNGYRGYRFPREIISLCVWLYHRFSLSFRDVEELLAKRGVVVSYETIRQWCRKFGPEYARKLKRSQGRLGDVWHLDEVFVKITGERHYLWRAVDQDGDVIDIAAHRMPMPGVDHNTARYENDRAELSHQSTRQRERQMRGFKSAGQALRFLSVHGVILNFFRFARHLMRAVNYRLLRTGSFKEWSAATGA
jgi:putative transposase